MKKGSGPRVVGRLAGKVLSLPPVRSSVHKLAAIAIPMRDGIQLVTTIFSPFKLDASGNIVTPVIDDAAIPKYPTVLIRTPYNRKNLDFVGERFSERGYHVVIQDIRGRCDSQGDMEPLLHDHTDAQDTVTWLRQRSWFKVHPKWSMWGISFLGMVQYAAMSAENPESNPTCLCPIMCSSRLYPIFNPNEGISYSLFVRWHYVTTSLNKDTNLLKLAVVMKKLDGCTNPAFSKNIDEVDKVITKKDEESTLGRLLRENLQSPEGGEFYQHRDNTAKLTRPVPTLLIAGWYDFFLREQLRDYMVMASAPHHERIELVVGPWHHFHPGAGITGFKEGLWFFESMQESPVVRPDRAPVRLYVMGLDKWFSYQSFPPPCTNVHVYLHGKSQLSGCNAYGDDDLETDRYTFDPCFPTPHKSGPEFHPTDGGIANQSNIEKRADVLKFTSPPAASKLIIVGFVKAVLYIRTNAKCTDFVCRLCVVKGPLKISTNICEGMVRIHEDEGEQLDDGSKRIEVDMWATAFCFHPGDRLRLHVCSGAFPRLHANPGTGERVPKVVEGRFQGVPQHQEIFHDSKHPSSLVLPVVSSIDDPLPLQDINVVFPVPSASNSSCMFASSSTQASSTPTSTPISTPVASSSAAAALETSSEIPFSPTQLVFAQEENSEVMSPRLPDESLTESKLAEEFEAISRGVSEIIQQQVDTEIQKGPTNN